MGIGKRRAELVSAMENGGRMRKVLESYSLPYLDQLILIVLTIAILTYSLYTFSAPNLPENHSMMLTIPFVIYGIFRYLFLMQVEGHGEAPEEVLLTDRPLQATLLLWGLSILLIFYISCTDARHHCHRTRQDHPVRGTCRRLRPTGHRSAG